jgi:hypothetical protein
MALNGKYISSYSVIRSIYRDTDLTSEVDVSSALEWSVEFLDLVNAPRVFRPEVQLITIEDYKGKLPCNYRQMTHATGATENGLIFDMSYSNNTFHPTHSIVNNGVNLSTNGTGWANLIIDTTNPIGVDQAGNPVFNFINSSTNLSLVAQLTESLSSRIPKEATYTLNDNYIFTSFRDGYALLSYVAYPFDCEGFPLIPDNIKFKYGLQWFIQEKIDYKLFREEKISKTIYDMSVVERDWYMGAASSEGSNLNLDQLENFKTMMLKYIRRDDLHSRAFS